MKAPLAKVRGRLLVRLPFSFFFFLYGGLGGKVKLGASKGGLDHEDGIRFFYVLHRPFRPRSAFE
jgi:hypothetical protein